MRKTLLKLTVIALFLSVFSCKNEKTTTDFDYKYAETENVLNCDNLDTKLYNEALLAFEAEIMKVYNTRNEDIRIAYTSFFRAVQRNGVNYQELASPHTMKVFEALKNDSDLWTENNQLNYKADIFTCIGNNLSDQGLATTYKALIETNSMHFDIFSAPLTTKIKTVNNDHYLGAFMALDMFYSKLFNVDPTQVKENEQNQKPVNSKQTKVNISDKQNLQLKPTEDSHAGHNHD